MKELEKERLEKLKELKKNFKPLSKDELTSHSRKYDEVLRSKKEELKKKRGLECLESSESNYKSRFYE